MKLRKTISILLTLAMVAALFAGITVMAGAEAPHIHDGVTFETPIGDLQTLKALFENGGSGYLTANITADGLLTTAAGTTVTLCLNGKTLTLNTGFRFNVAGTLNLYGYEGGTVTGGSFNSKGGSAYVYKGATFNLYSGTIQNSSATGSGSGNGLGGAVFIEGGGTFNMYGGTIKDCTANRFGGAVEAYGAFNLYDGTIDNCTANSNNGGAVEVESTGRMTMYGGTISKCKAMGTGNSAKAGGVAVAGVFDMKGGTITDCTAYNGGGAVYVYKGCKFTMNGGTIAKCSATFGGGVNYAGTFTMNDGLIDACSCTGRGGGVYGWNGGKFIMNGGTIRNCTTPVKGYGGGVCLLDSATAIMTGGTICNNKTGSTAHGGGVYVAEGGVEWNGRSVPTTAQFLMSGGEISGNYASWSGGAVFCEARGSFLMTGGTIRDNSGGSYGHNVGVYQENNDAGNAASWVYLKGGSIIGSGSQNVTKSQYGRLMIWDKTVQLTSVTYNGSHVTNTDAATFAELSTAVSNAPDNGSATMITLTKDMTATSGLGKAGSNIVLDLNGKTLDLNGYNLSVPSSDTALTTGTALTIMDSGVGGTITGGRGSHGGAIASIGKVGGEPNTVILESGTIRNCASAADDYYGGGALYLNNNAHFIMNGGAIEDCTADRYGGAVRVYNYSSFTMNGGTISGCSVTSTTKGYAKGGAVYVEGTTNSTFTMTGGEIHGCTSKRDGVDAPAVALHGGTFNMSGGIIWGNRNITDGVVRGLYCENGTVLNQTGGYIDPKTVITLDANGGAGGTEKVTVAYGDAAMPVIETLPTRPTMHISGYFDAAKDGTKYYNGDGTGVSEMTFWNKLDTAMTLFAQWEMDTYTVTLHKDGGACEDLTSYTCGTGAVLPTATKAGYKFDGWFDNAQFTGTAVTAISATDTGNKEFWAKWTPTAEVVEPAQAEGVPSAQAKIGTGGLSTMRFMWKLNVTDGAQIESVGAYIIPWTLKDTDGMNSVKVEYPNPGLANGNTFSADLTGIPEWAREIEIYAIPLLNGSPVSGALTATVTEANIDQ